ncbi:hypothetical protein [Mycoplasma sp. SG1]|uniref:hypothetical protein n=1 Tax=Mycoplasma sp. SG1 TaxID=2810348 RepID=UPI0020251991|nr:hypothetical protein [Mycoplasma sp. SG1]URM52998.1 hypothetical protein JRW51_01470 [Mycoplasma sp. SG1]
MKNIAISNKSEILKKINLDVAYISGIYNLNLNGRHFILIVNFDENGEKGYVYLMGKKYSHSYLYRYGGVTTGLKVLVRELWLRHIENRPEQEIKNDIDKFHQKHIKILEFNKSFVQKNLEDLIKNYPGFDSLYEDTKKTLKTIYETENDRYTQLKKQIKVLGYTIRKIELSCPEIQEKRTNEIIERWKISNPELYKIWKNNKTF